MAISGHGNSSQCFSLDGLAVVVLFNLLLREFVVAHLLKVALLFLEGTLDGALTVQG